MVNDYSETVERPPRMSIGAVGWMRANLFGNWYNGLLTVMCGVAVALGAWFGLKWIFVTAGLVGDSPTRRPVSSSVSSTP